MKFQPLVFCLLLAACATPPSPAERRELADTLAAARGWRALNFLAGSFELAGYAPDRATPADTLSIYIEGDGFAWLNNSQPSADPTPRDPLALRLALAQPDGAAAYLARPCQYIDAESAACASRYWTEHRFAPEVVAAANQAVDALKQRFGAKRLTLVGYSGGGAVASLVAARRNDVTRLVTVAGNLDHPAWTAHHRVRQLAGSLNPADEIDALRGIRQWHYVGGQDGNIVPALVRGFAGRFPAEERPAVVIVPEFDHRCCWAERWPSMWRDMDELRR